LSASSWLTLLNVSANSAAALSASVILCAYK
jgi:hypothetical protein